MVGWGAALGCVGGVMEPMDAFTHLSDALYLRKCLMLSRALTVSSIPCGASAVLAFLAAEPELGWVFLRAGAIATLT